MIKTLQSIIYERGSLKVLDQLLLPLETKYVDVKNITDGWNVINSMQVRGAPAIAIVGCLSLAEELLSFLRSDISKFELSKLIGDKLNYLITSRPTAVNLQLAADKVLVLTQKLEKDESTHKNGMIEELVKTIEEMLEKDIADNKAIGTHGAAKISQLTQGQINVLTHCNTGSLATAGYGTALGVIRSLNSENKLEHVYFTETRPYMQGARLTSYELLSEGIPSTLICDSAVSILMKQKNISAVVVGADRVAANGDTANKIGTYQIAVTAKYHNVPFFIAAPFSTIDFSTANGSMIPIEERSPLEMTLIKGTKITPSEINCWNPSFDVTPAELITGIITEKGVFPPDGIIPN